MGRTSVYRHLVFHAMTTLIPVMAVVRFLSHHTRELEPCNQVDCIYHNEENHLLSSRIMPYFARRPHQPYSGDVGDYLTVRNGVSVEFLPWVRHEHPDTRLFLDGLAAGLTKSWGTMNATAVHELQQTCGTTDMYHRILLDDTASYATLIYIFFGVQFVLSLSHDMFLLHRPDSQARASATGVLEIASSNITMILAVNATRLCASLATTFVAVDTDSGRACFYWFPGHLMLAVLAAMCVIWKWTFLYLPYNLRALTYGASYDFRQDIVPTYVVLASVDAGLMKDEADYFVMPPALGVEVPHSTFLHFIPRWSFTEIRQVFRLAALRSVDWKWVPMVVFAWIFGAFFAGVALMRDIMKWQGRFARRSDAFEGLLLDVVDIMVAVVALLYVLVLALLGFFMTQKRFTFESRVHIYLMWWELWFTGHLAWFSRDLVLGSLNAAFLLAQPARGEGQDSRAKAKPSNTKLAFLAVFLISICVKLRQYRVFLKHSAGPHCSERSCLIEPEEDKVSEEKYSEVSSDSEITLDAAPITN